MNTDLMFSTGQDVYGTPDNIFKALNSEFNFTLDAAALPENAKCDKYFTPQQDALIQDWSKQIVFCNPPYSRPLQGKFIQKAFEESKKGATVVMLIPSRTDTKIFHEVILPNAEVRFIKGRLKFGDSKNAAPFPSMIVIFRPKKMIYAHF